MSRLKWHKPVSQADVQALRSTIANTFVRDVPVIKQRPIPATSHDHGKDLQRSRFLQAHQDRQAIMERQADVRREQRMRKKQQQDVVIDVSLNEVREQINKRREREHRQLGEERNERGFYGAKPITPRGGSDHHAAPTPVKRLQTTKRRRQPGHGGLSAAPRSTSSPLAQRLHDLAQQPREAAQPCAAPAPAKADGTRRLVLPFAQMPRPRAAAAARGEALAAAAVSQRPATGHKGHRPRQAVGCSARPAQERAQRPTTGCKLRRTAGGAAHDAPPHAAAREGGLTRTGAVQRRSAAAPWSAPGREGRTPSSTSTSRAQCGPRVDQVKRAHREGGASRAAPHAQADDAGGAAMGSSRRLAARAGCKSEPAARAGGAPQPAQPVPAQRSDLFQRATALQSQLRDEVEKSEARALAAVQRGAGPGRVAAPVNDAQVIRQSHERRALENLWRPLTAAERQRKMALDSEIDYAEEIKLQQELTMVQARLATELKLQQHLNGTHVNGRS